MIERGVWLIDYLPNTPLGHTRERLSHGEAIDTLNQFCSLTQMKGYTKKHYRSGPKCGERTIE